MIHDYDSNNHNRVYCEKNCCKFDVNSVTICKLFTVSGKRLAHVDQVEDIEENDLANINKDIVWTDEALAQHSLISKT